MAHYTGPRRKVMRALGVELPGLSRKSIESRNHPPGQHGRKLSRKSDYAKKLQEKQKLRFNYGLGERQIQRLFLEAKSSKQPTGDKLLELLECRLDNFVFRTGFAPTIVAARQLVRHRHIRLNGRLVNIPSIRTKPGDEISLGARAVSIPTVIECIDTPALERPEWLHFDAAAKTARMTRAPAADEVPFPVEVQQVVEYYAKRI